MLLINIFIISSHSSYFGEDLTRSTADAVERPSPINLLRAAVMGISENTQI